MVRTIITAETTHIEFDVDPEYVGKKLEIIYSSLDEKGSEPKKKTMADFWGILSDESAEKLREEIKNSRDEWERYI